MCRVTKALRSKYKRQFEYLKAIMGKTHQQKGLWKYLVLIAGFWNILITFGTVNATGVFIVEWMVYYDIGAAAASSIAVGTSFVVPLLSPYAGVMCQRFGCGRVCIAGGIVTSVSFGIASFSPNMPFLVTMICIFGFGMTFVLIPCYAVIGYYFKGHLAFANGVMMSGASGGVLAITPLIQYLCTTYNWRGAILIMSAIYANTIVSGMIFYPTREEKANIEKMRSRQADKHDTQTDLPLNDEGSAHLIHNLEHLETEAFMHEISQDSDMDKSIEKRTHLVMCFASFKNCIRLVFAPILKVLTLLQFNLLWMNPRLGLFCLACFISNCGYFSHMVYLISRVVYDLGESKQHAAILMAIIGFAGIIGGIAQGPLVDKGIITINSLAPISLVITGISSVMNPLANSFAGQVISAIATGIGSGIFLALGPMYIRQLVGQQFTGSGNGLRIMSLGLGNAMGSISMGALYDATGSFSMVFYVAGGFSFLGAAVTLAMACHTVKTFEGDGSY